MTEDGNAQNHVQPRSIGFAIAGALIGAVAGYFCFDVLLNRFGMYAMVLPGALIGIGRVSGSPVKSIPLGVACGLVTATLSIAIEWNITPMTDDATFADFLRMLPDKPFRNQASLIVGTLVALWFGMGRNPAHGNTGGQTSILN